MKVRFIINPIAGINRKVDLKALIEAGMSSEHDLDIATTERAGHATEIAREAVENNYDAVIAVGGDGSMNEIAQSLVGSQTALGFLPCGSGNGLARHLKIPLKLRQAVALINGRHNFRQIDAGMVNEHYFFNVAGVGFDALISREFAKYKGRGFITYIKSILKNITNYKARTYTLQYDDTERKVSAKIIALANSKQYGNNFLIAPNASITDGQLDVCIVPGFWKMLNLGALLGYVFGKYYRNRAVPSTKMKGLTISAEEELVMHVDGEPVSVGNSATIKVVPGTLKVLTA